MRTAQDAKAMAKSIRQSLATRNLDVSHSEALEIVARQFGYDTWNILSAKLEKEAANPPGGISFTQPVPIVRIFDEARAMEFYQGFLGFSLDWQHRFHPGAPLTARSRSAACACISPSIPATPVPVAPASST